ncbi:PH and SEC7 domain-containing protein C11E3.11c [Tolypocladium paradoxum]|uniref:PH and SEC7 domain-containing protein C11E3.11c n=1 Tax=Tolypocladium paradoxum TaxID=94208 RepID=A0A2S4KZC0_9HYPO|nr:PH and SEC7 domain-containing protein C11E3.11c [Tolypocladium paradoxum]
MAENQTPQAAAAGPRRDSHDLSLSPRDVTRDSLVANMLLSLDQFSLGQQPQSHSGPFAGGPSPGYEHDGGYSPRPWTNNTATNNGAATRSSASAGASANGHGHGHSHSHARRFSFSSVETPTDDSSRMSSQNSRDRRSNNSSNTFQGQFTRLNSMRETSYRNQPGTPPRSSHARGGRHSIKSSRSSASIDPGYSPNIGSQHHGHHRAARSASFDFGPPPSQSQSPLQQLALSSPFRVDFPDSFAATAVDDDYAAAPTPTVPSGPRREPFALSMAHPPPPEPVEPRTLERKRSTSRSLKSSSGARGKRANGHQTPGAAAAAAASAMSTVELDSAPAPNVGYGKSKETAGESSTSIAPSHAKERPGFFRRVFGGGSSKNNTGSASNSQDQQASASRFPATTERPGSDKPQQQQYTGQAKTTSAPPSRDTSSSHSHHHPTLQKKSSSFFRRRKKSVAADEPPPLPSTEHAPPVPPVDPIHLHAAREHLGSAQRSPTSSLRNVMNPYLIDGATGLGLSGVQTSSPLADITNTAGERTPDRAGREEYKRDFSPDYEPSPNARIRTVHPEGDGERTEEADTPSRPAPQRPRRTHETTNNSFLDLDGGSDHDEDSPKRHRRKSSANRDLGNEAFAATRSDKDPDATIRAGKKQTSAALEHADRDANRPNLGLPIEGARATSFASGSTETDYKTAPSAPPSVRVEGAISPGPKVLGTLKLMKSCKSLDEPEFVVGEPREDDRQKAQKIFDGGEGFIQKDKAAAWMGEEGPVRQRTLQAYMELHEFKDQSILGALRSVCGRLVLRAETQQVDRILVAFSKRWCACNPHHGFKATDVIHMICYSIMLLNTDLHLADIEQKMTRSQFVKNTMTTITQAVSESAPNAFVRPSILPDKNSLLSGDYGRASPDRDRASHRHSFRPLPRSDTHSDLDDCGPLVKTPFSGSMRAWEEQVENVLKSIYASIRDERLPLFGAESDKHLGTAPSQSSLSVKGMLKRSPSALSKAPSETQPSSRGRVADNSSRTSASRWTSKSRSRPGLGRTGLSSSRTSFDDGNSMWSPAMSSATWSKYSLGRTQGSMSQDSFASAMARGDYQQSIGFANALSQAIIRDEDASGNETAPSILSADIPAMQLLDDESLELAGPPWVKEGMVIHKHHLDSVGKRSKDRNWTEVFAVVQKGQMSLFSFTTPKSLRQKSRSRNPGKPSGPVGGGNWQDNAVSLGTFNLRLTLASALPPPGYSRTRPHVWALSLPTGAVHLFQVGTSEIIREFVTTANYWSARLSTHPLVGGISNIEYGWSEAIVNNALVSAINESATSVASGGQSSRPESSAAHGRRSSVASGSFRASSFDQVGGPFAPNSGRGKLPGDRIHIAEWSPPTQSMRPSNAPEAEQLETLIAYIKSIEQDLQAHNRMRSPMLLAFTPRGQNAGKAMVNWERKSAYLLREIVKFRTYVDCLQQAETRKGEIYTERDLARKAARGELSDGDMDVSDEEEEEGDETLRP